MFRVMETLRKVETSEREETFGEVETPAALVELEVVAGNARKVAGYLRSHGLAWRPHVKTHKSLAMARLQLEAGATGLTVATPREAEVMARVCDDVLLAHPPVGSKARRIMALPPSVRLAVALDSPEALEDLAEAAADAGREVGVLVEVDVGMGRVGLDDPSAVVRLAEAAGEGKGVRFQGILFYPGHIRVPGEEQGEALAEVSTRLGRVLEALERAGLPPATVSGGSSPTLWRSHEIPGLTEVRAGTCIFHDRDMLTLGVCRDSEIAYTVLASVVSTAVPGQAVVDAGSKALAKEAFRAEGGGYGLVVDHPDVRVSALSEEHGILDLSDSPWTPRVGERVRIIPNHVCVSVNLQDRLLALDADGGLTPIPIEARGRLAGSHN